MSDFSELTELAEQIASAPAEAEPFIKKALEYTSFNLRDDWRQGAAVSGSYARSYPAAISYDLHGFTGFGGAEFYSEIGPVLRRTPGAGAGFLEEGGGGVDGPAHHAGREALEANEDDFYEGLAVALFDGTKKALGAS